MSYNELYCTTKRAPAKRHIQTQAFQIQALDRFVFAFLISMISLIKCQLGHWTVNCLESLNFRLPSVFFLLEFLNFLRSKFEIQMQLFCLLKEREREREQTACTSQEFIWVHSARRRAPCRALECISIKFIIHEWRRSSYDIKARKFKF